MCMETTKGSRSEKEAFQRWLRGGGRVVGRDDIRSALEPLACRDGFLPEGVHRYAQAYGQVHAVMPSFPAHPHGDTTGWPTFCGTKLSLADLVRWSLNPEESGVRFDKLPVRKARQYAPFVAQSELAEMFAELLSHLPSHVPRWQVMEANAKWFARVVERSKRGIYSTMFSPVCPDYTKNAEGLYDFRGLGTGVGTVAQSVLDALPKLHKFFTTHGLLVEFVIGGGDIEAEDQKILDRLKLTQAEFVQRVSLSQQAFLQQARAMVPDARISTPLISEINNGLWPYCRAVGKKAVKAGLFSGPIVLTDADWRHVVKAREDLIRRWLGPDADVLGFVREQGSQYGAIAHLVHHSYSNPLFLCADSFAMNLFWQGVTSEARPVIHIKVRDY